MAVLLMWLAYYSDLKIQKWANLDKLYRWNYGIFYFWAIFGVNFDPLMVSRLWMGQFLLKYDMLYHFGNGRTTARHMCWFWNNISMLRWFFGAKYTFKKRRKKNWAKSRLFPWKIFSYTWYFYHIPCARGWFQDYKTI